MLLLKVSEAIQDDVGKGIVRIPSKIMKKLDLRPGDAIEIKGSRRTVSIVDRAYPSDIGLDIIRMDAVTRTNAGTSIGEFVQIKKIELKEAKSITLAPSQEGVKITISGSTDIIKRSLLGRALIAGDIVSLGGSTKRRSVFSGNPFLDEIFPLIGDELGGFGLPFSLKSLKWVVVSTTPKDPVIITNNTKLIIKPEAVKLNERKVPDIAYEDVGGLDEEIKKIREMVELPLKHPEIFDRIGIEPPKGVLLYGPPGTGKTLLAKAVANEADAYFLTINGPEIMSKWVGEAEKKIRKIFEDAEKNAPSIIFIDEIDAIAPKREDVMGEVERRVVAQLLTLMDGLKSRGRVIVIGATNRVNAIDPALRRPGRFDREIEIGVPSRKGRLEILKIHTRNMPLSKDVNLEKLADITHGFVGADLAALAKEAAMRAIRRLLSSIKLTDEDEPLPQEELDKIQVTQEDFNEALRLVRPSAMREVLVEVPNIKWGDIGGLDEVKKELMEAVEWPLKYPDTFKEIGVKPPKGILLYGPPGTGKTLLAKAVANESESNFISVKGPEVLSKWVGESEKAIREIFRKARQVSPCVVFFDEIDAIAGVRGRGIDSNVTERVVNQLLTEMDGLEGLKDVVVIAATNRPDMIDPGLIRPGRFDRLIYIRPPDEKAREEIFKVHTKNMKLSKDVSLKELAKKTEGYTGADIEALVREAGMEAVREIINGKKTKEVKLKHFNKAFEKIKPSLNKQIIQMYETFEHRRKQQATSISKERSYLG